jgi:predicted type IV restriction endonuclease
VEIDKFIRKLKRNINKNKEFYVHNEEAVKLQIVVPFLGMLGWDFKNPDQVVPESVISVDKRVKIKLVYLL